ncbi:hypothetical protein TTHERM_000912349 (macronuclear) [Tetrahymena thermophila SB210]|uniref:Uncharacterized protein n=1 Tax=Tetrahymena thermophila (strain SB210) TaxID=312017 RepID=W7XAH0_TETTS|nr:hypothetical protein TTHERM_000912349 [Tetrahymena thermophila SB210]EWS73398.1 hypothetical protein TTHERM_000912349 [Tetrahymena thermophila SB210]|eukprot:XP_012654071.1 hypothetical protein TTHERM_000912349 [Tetrahymena thermophila SB210]
MIQIKIFVYIILHQNKQSNIMQNRKLVELTINLRSDSQCISILIKIIMKRICAQFQKTINLYPKQYYIWYEWSDSVQRKVCQIGELVYLDDRLKSDKKLGIRVVKFKNQKYYQENECSQYFKYMLTHIQERYYIKNQLNKKVYQMMEYEDKEDSVYIIPQQEYIIQNEQPVKINVFNQQNNLNFKRITSQQKQFIKMKKVSMKSFQIHFQNKKISKILLENQFKKSNSKINPTNYKQYQSKNKRI